MAGLPAMELHISPVAERGASDDDGALVLAAQRDPRAFADLYLRYVGSVYRYCHRRLGTKEAAEDATSVVFTKALAGLPRYRPDGPSFRAWLFAIAHNVVIDVHRSTRPVLPIDLMGDHPDRTPGPEVTALAAEERRSIDGLLAVIAPDQRRVLELRLAGLTTAEIAAALGRRPAAVRATQFRAVARLRTLLGGESRTQEGDHA